MKRNKETGEELARMLNELLPTHDELVEDDVEFLNGVCVNLTRDGFNSLQAIVGGYIHLNDLDAERVYARALRHHEAAVSDSTISVAGKLDLSKADSLESIKAKVEDTLRELGAKRGLGEPPEGLAERIAQDAWGQLHPEDEIDREVEEFARVLDTLKPEDLGQA